MKLAYILFGIALIVFLFTGFGYFKSKQSKRSVPLARAGITKTLTKFRKTFFDVGVQKQNIPVSVQFIMYNVGSNQLFIEKVEPDCHCTEANFSKMPVQPGDSAVITLKYDATNLGPFQASALVSSNAAASPGLLVFRGVVHQ